MSYGIAGLDRCADCRKVCACAGPECSCMVIDAAQGDLTCFPCTDTRDAS